MKDYLQKIVENKKIIIIGFGREGKSTYKTLRSFFPEIPIAIADINDSKAIEISNDRNITFITGENYLDSIKTYNLVFKTPGITLKRLNNKININKITSQTDIFLNVFGRQVIGVTGTKGKSTTSSLIYHILKTAGKDAVLLGNIGSPPFNFINSINENTVIVFELSSHQLESVTASPYFAVLLNFYEEHLNDYISYQEYKNAKFNITRFQKEDGNLIYNFDDYQIGDMIRENSLQRNYYGYSLDNVPERGMKIKDNYLIFTNNNLEEKIYNLKDKRKLLGEHNILNIMAAAIVCNLLNIKNSDISAGINSFSPLPHRLEYIGVFCGIHFYNDSIATIPEATIRAVQTLKTVDTLIVGGFDRGINYQPLVDFIAASEIQNIICTGDAGKRISYLLNEKEKKYLFTESYEEIIQLAMKYTRKNTICLLSPAAASYDKFKNFEERGNVFKELLKNY